MKIMITTQLSDGEYFTDQVYLCKSDVVKFVEENIDKIEQDFSFFITKETTKEKTKAFKVTEIYQ